MRETPLNPLPRTGIDYPQGGVLGFLKTKDHKFIRYGIWSGGEEGSIILMNGRTDYIEKYNQVIENLLKRKYSVITLDWRGQGLSQRPRGRHDIGHIENFFEYQNDLEIVLESLDDKIHSTNRVLFAQGMGGCIGLRSLLRGLKVTSAIFCSPMWGLSIPILPQTLIPTIGNIIVSMGLGMLKIPYNKDGLSLLNKKFSENVMTNNLAEFERTVKNLLFDKRFGVGSPTVSWITAATVEMTKLSKMPPPEVPQLVLLGEKDNVVSPEPIINRIARSPKGELAIIPNSFHEILFDSEEVQNLAWQKIDEFLNHNNELSKTSSVSRGMI